LSSKNTKTERKIRESWAEVHRLFYRVVPVCVVTLIVYALSFTHYAGGDVSVFGYTRRSWPYREELGDAVLCAQNISMLIYVFQVGISLHLIVVVISASFLRRKNFIFAGYYPWYNKPWIFASVTSLILQVVFFVGQTMSSQDRFEVDSLPWWVWVVGVGSVPGTLGLQEWFKGMDRREFVQWQRRLKLEFNTKLGMHSPL
jgi:hypothetical protein